MSTVSKPLRATLLVTIALGAGAMLYNRSGDPDPSPEPTFPLALIDREASTATTWLAPPVTRDPFASPDGLSIDEAAVFESPPDSVGPDGSVVVDSGAAGGDQPVTTVPARVTTTLDERSIAEVFESRLPSTTTTPVGP